ncbi:hypothetical protein MAPG_11745 [Magnaporthiopsis poae ATCC 64411]|uniref:Choline transporter n=1 Tax=Magnaporthiopsis poae (strain ATCC 64411 / 73-15) TaxID=644358 RepID=A0A0C4EG29_MAGP6|nr:hypothetical protein MAPG_11745 [Magnaporthiopsis poae ATCC 64411]
MAAKQSSERMSSVEVADGGSVATRISKAGPDGTTLSRLGNTDSDDQNMRALGRQQELSASSIQVFTFIPTLGFSCTMMNTWELTLMTSSYSLTMGGLAGMVWGYTIVCFGYLLVFASLAEMASMTPTSAAQYHWVSEFGPPGQQRFLSYVAGWTAVLGWQAGMATITYVVAGMIQGTIALCYPDTYVSQNWHLAILTVGVNAYCVLFNTSLVRRLPMVEGVVLIMHILGFFVVLVPLWTLAPRTDPARVFTEFMNLGGWSSQGLSFVIGLTVPAYNLFGADAPVHMAEEVREAAVMVPRAMMWAYIINAAQAWVLVVSLCFCIGDLEEVLQSPTGVAYIQVFQNVTQSAAATAAMVAMIAVCLTSAAIATLAAMSRLTWAFARDRGLPCSAWIAHVRL